MFISTIFLNSVQHLSSHHPFFFPSFKQLLLGNSAQLNLNIDINIKAISINHRPRIRHTFYWGVVLTFIVRDGQGHGFIASVIYEPSS